uniref:Biogenesis of lysosome-related organelles complex 1 subunit 2 n=1 Tax=Elaeophora elaphi TaxID=1147741 RepID=A0A0R3S2G0_9BILA
MGANLDLSLVADLPHQNMVMVLVTELINFQDRLIACLEEVDAYYSAQLTTTVNKTLDKMHDYSRRLQALNRNILELTKRVRLMILRVQALDNGKNEAVDLLVIC